jgi:hypothetical protein
MEKNEHPKFISALERKGVNASCPMCNEYPLFPHNMKLVLNDEDTLSAMDTFVLMRSKCGHIILFSKSILLNESTYGMEP